MRYICVDCQTEVVVTTTAARPADSIQMECRICDVEREFVRAAEQ